MGELGGRREERLSTDEKKKKATDKKLTKLLFILISVSWGKHE